MKIADKHYTTIWEKENDPEVIQIIDQRPLPHRFEIEDLSSTTDFENAIRDMHVRGAPLIGATAAYGVYMACLEAAKSDDFERSLTAAVKRLKATRPTAVDLFNLVDRCVEAINRVDDIASKIDTALSDARSICTEIREHCKQIGINGAKLIKELYNKTGRTVNILTHCNAGWFATIDYGTATAPIYEAHRLGIPLHIWVDETRPRNQGARITAFELGQEGIEHTVIADNTGGLLMQRGLVDMVIVGSDRTSREGDVANKIGTYLKALAAHDNSVPFYAALPESSFDWEIRDGVRTIPIEERSAQEVKYIQGLDEEGNMRQVLLCPKDSKALNYGFDVTPARYITGIITERGVCEANETSIISLYPEKADL